MKKNEWNEGLNHLDSEIVEKYVEQKDRLRQKNKKLKRIRLRLGAIAACFALIIGTVIFKNDSPPVPNWENALYSAEDISSLCASLGTLDASTNAYTKIYAPKSEYLYIGDIPNDEYIDLYKYNDLKTELNKDEFQSLIESFLPKLENSLGASASELNIRENKTDIDISFDIGHYYLSASQSETSYIFFMNEKKVILNGETIQIDQSLTDEEIKAYIQSTKNVLFDIFGVDFPDIKISRHFDSDYEYGARSIYVYFYDNNAHPLNNSRYIPLTDFICIEYYTSQEDENNSILDDPTIYYVKRRVEMTDMYTPYTKTKRISLQDAEALLYNGYVFGGHICKLCQRSQKKIAFDDYDFVDIEYVFNNSNKTDDTTSGIPFYTFYKNIGKAENGNTIYAKTYVAAIEVSGYKEYFKSQQDFHKNNWFN